MKRAVQSLLLGWYDKNRRRLPWRERPSPYRTWVSEVMLQQTQVATVLPYYERFLRRFPDIASLAGAGEGEVLRHWAGLGYYSRARNLHRAAKEITSRHGGDFPDEWEQVMDLPGIGRYSAGAVLSIAFQKPYPVLDGNVARVLSRLFGIRQDVKSAAAQKKLWALAGDVLDRRRPGDWNQALMELGALVCVPESPRCGSCPLTRYCFAYKNNLQDSLPRLAAKRPPVDLRWTCLWIEDKGRVLLWRRADSERFLKGHWSLPEPRHLKSAAVRDTMRAVRHTITNHRIVLDVRRGSVDENRLPEGARWVPRARLRRYLVSSLWLKACGFSRPGGAGASPRS